jgi:hypothetical protein
MKGGRGESSFQADGQGVKPLRGRPITTIFHSIPFILQEIVAQTLQMIGLHDGHTDTVLYHQFSETLSVNQNDLAIYVFGEINCSGVNEDVVIYTPFLALLIDGLQRIFGFRPADAFSSALPGVDTSRPACPR